MQENRTAVCLACGITVHTLGGIRDLLMRQIKQPREIEVDLTGVSVVDSAGLRGLLMLRSEAFRHNRVVRFVSSNKAFMSLLEHMDDAFSRGLSIEARLSRSHSPESAREAA
ncbi:MAG: STAS domain-containing protein [Sulfuricella sp.]